MTCTTNIGTDAHFTIEPSMGANDVHTFELATMRQMCRIWETHPMTVLVLMVQVQQEVFKPIFTGHDISLKDEVSYSIIAYHTASVMSGKAC